MTTPAPQPQWDETDGLNRAREADRLHTLHAAELAPRLPAGFATTLNADRAALGDPTALAALRTQRTATAATHDVAADGHELVLAVRAVLTDAHAPSALCKALGVGDGMTRHEPQKVRDALDAIVSHAAELAPYGIIADDVHDAETLSHAIADKRNAQGVAFSHRHDTTETRVAARLRIEGAVGSLSRIGELAFRKNARIRAQFHSLIEHATFTPVADEAPAPTPPATPAAPATPPAAPAT